MLGSLLPSEMKKDWKKSWLWKTVRLLAIAYGTLALFACTLADRMLFIPPPPSYSLSDEGLVQFGADKEFAGFYFPAEKEEAPILLWAHGNGEDADALTLRTAFGYQTGEYKGFSALVEAEDVREIFSVNDFTFFICHGFLFFTLNDRRGFL